MVDGVVFVTMALRATNGAPETYTFWDYQAGAWNKNNGSRIDHILLSPQAADYLQACAIDKHTRGWEKPFYELENGLIHSTSNAIRGDPVLLTRDRYWECG